MSTLDGLTPLETREPDTPVARAVRMLRLIDLQLDSMERTMASGEPMSSQDRERNARTTTALTNLAETVTQTIANKDMVANDGRVQATDVCAEADQLRHEIAARIERLNEKWLAERDC